MAEDNTANEAAYNAAKTADCGLCWRFFQTLSHKLGAQFNASVPGHVHRFKRICRLVSNSRFNFHAVMEAIWLHNLALALKAGSRKVVLVDITFLTAQLAVLAVASAFRGGAVPLCPLPLASLGLENVIQTG